jgi:hypothetical protein
LSRPLSILAAALLLLGGALACDADRSRAQQKRFASLRLGQTGEQVRVAFGNPARICSGAASLAEHQGQARNGAAVIRALSSRTATHWIYPFDPIHPPPDCRPRYNDTDIGFDAEGKVVWFIVQTYETELQH